MKPHASLIHHSLRVWSQADAQAIDHLSISHFARQGQALMEEAGAALATFIHAHQPTSSPILVLAGPGNNGGDALVLARHLAQKGRELHLCLLGKQDKASALQRAMLAACLDIGLQAHSDESILSHIDAHRHWTVVDGVYGLGFRGPTCDLPVTQALTSIAQHLPQRRVYAIDIPSGLRADAWEQAPPPLPADVTLTFGQAKACHLLYPSRRWCGDTHVIPLDFAPEAIKAVMSESDGQDAQLWQCQESLLAASPWASLAADAHKFSRGHVLVAGGDDGTTGAAYLAGMAALRAGAGWVTLMTKASVGFQASHPELTYSQAWHNTHFDAKVVETLCRERHARALVIGPGLREGLDKASWEILARCQQSYGLFLVVDAGALQDFWPRTADLRFDPARTLLTPHPGEWRKMFAADEAPALEEWSQLAAVQMLLAARGVTVIYKTASPLVFSPSEETRVYLCPAGSISLAKAGSGDVLSGTAGAHGACGSTAALAAARAYTCMAAAARAAAAVVGTQGVIASDLIAHIGKFN